MTHVIIYTFAVWVLTELILMVVWFKKSKIIRKNLRMWILTGYVKENSTNHLYIRSEPISVIISNLTFHVTLDGARLLATEEFNLNTGILQTILHKRLYHRAKENIKIKEALE